ncbi:SDR family oxidoreductase [Jiulongibacter sediminis]|uniref:dTDP-4-dehydrorhamnose reductase n=1 Tax=Jiulongibacter sediminis TaxID=1605367 RepID=A0A0P7BV28_9BACT|nr:SDR family oxidoreductase [Jiulongibacter sediminis]KPM48554.1 reductase [Jiulongibacter sediminis]TBX25092.1 reductase [Jiulongibacter sediminis]
MKRKILVLGANGMAGHVIITHLRKMSEKFEVYSIARTYSEIHPTKLMDISNFQELREYIYSIMPDVIVNCVGILNKMADESQDLAILVNSYLPHFLKNLTKDLKLKVVHISTDCVFSGREGNYTENSVKDGTGTYAQTKSLGEICNSKDLTIRTSIIGPELNINGIGLFNWFMQQKGTINGYKRAIWTGITTIELAKATVAAIEQDLSGIYNLVNGSKISKFDLLVLMNNTFVKSLTIKENSEYAVDKSLVCTRENFDYVVPSYEEMVTEMKSWIDTHTGFYAHYL